MPQLLPYLQLCRLPTVFTSMADIFLGYLLIHSGILRDAGRPGEFLLLLGASSCLYVSGMVWNDVFDRDVDRTQRPTRPIPSGRVRLSNAVMLGAGLTALGIAFTLAVSKVAAASGESFNPAPPCVALLLVTAILAYDALFKRPGFGPLGPLTMGTCRLLNVTLGASTVPGGLIDDFVSTPLMMVPVGMGIYVAGLTWFARTEATLSNRTHLMGAMLVINVGLATLIGWIANTPGQSLTAILLTMGVIVLTINRRLAAAIAHPLPERVQPTIRTMLLSIIVLDATLIAHRLGPAGISYAIATIALLFPAMLLGRWLRLT